MHSLDLNGSQQQSSNIKTAHDYKLNKLNTKLADTETQLRKNQDEVAQLMQKTGANLQNPSSNSLQP